MAWGPTLPPCCAVKQCPHANSPTHNLECHPDFLDLLCELKRCQTSTNEAYEEFLKAERIAENQQLEIQRRLITATKRIVLIRAQCFQLRDVPHQPEPAPTCPPSPPFVKWSTLSLPFNPDCPVIMQWTGGRVGGHHSYEDFQTYRAIRQLNISLVGGNGVGAAEDVWPYLTGEWATKYDVQPMLLLCRGSHLRRGWYWRRAVEGTYVKPTGGILTVKSQLAEPIHKVATCGVKLWKEFDDTVFKLPKEKRAACLLERRDEIIGKLNRDFRKPWFGWKKDGSVAKELGDMTYEETVLLPLGGRVVVPFIPVLDATFDVWFEKDSLWAAEDIDAVLDQDQQRVCILQGPMAVKHSNVKDEPIKDLLGNIHNELAQRLLRVHVRRPLQAKTSVWLETLAGPELGWLRALTTSTTVVQGTSYIDNPIKRLLAPRTGQKTVVGYDAGKPISITVYGAARSYGEHKKSFKAVEIKYSASTNLIDITMFEDRRDVSVPLSLQFEYKPSQGFAPIHEIATGRNQRIKEFYWKLWYGDDQSLPEIDIRETFVGPEVTIESAAVEEFCAVVGNQGESFSAARNEEVSAPMDFAIVTGWQAIMKSIFPASIDGDLLRLVHLSNGFRMVPGEKPLRAGDVCKAEAKIVSVSNTDPGKVVKVKGHVLRAGKPVIEVVSAFLYRGRFTDYDTFETTDEPDYVVKLENDAAVGLLQSKEWFEWIDESKPLLAGTSLIFRLQSQVTFKDKTSYSNVTVTGEIFVRNQLKVLVPVGSVDFQQDGCRGNPVLAYVQRHGVVQDASTPLPNAGYTLNSTAISFNDPLTNEPYSKISGDFNPIHINPAIRSAFSPTTSFVGMVIPGDELTVKICHVGMRDGNIVVNIVTSNSRGEKVLEGSSEVSQPTTVYVFTGQGSQEH
ncbi:Fatty acid synthase [Mycena chlorophos]|uniref:Fatty acid synthase n=1 Tax=Mycena chlorophos TaxID=658473 RepID=A0A8H6T394_MYCCL|nr:Fatty acid synthase [Mycena chlorophos]